MNPVPVSDLPRTKDRRERDAVSEHESQVAVVQWASLMRAKWPELDMLFAIPNGGARSIATAGKLKAEGVKPGVPDLCLPVSRGGFLSCWIELKSGTGRRTESQKEWALRLVKLGHVVVTCFTAGQAIETLEDYLCGRLSKSR